MLPDGTLSLAVLDGMSGSTFQSWLCNCACSICMAGQCCMDPNRYTPPGGWATGTGYVWPVHEHVWQAVGLRKGDVIQSCSCGEVRRVAVP